jgi:hypothetical protein
MESNLWKNPLSINEKGYLTAQYNPLGFGWRAEETPILAFPSGCKGEGDTTAKEWQRSQLPPSMSMSAYLLFQHFTGSDDPDVFLEPTPIPQRITIAMGHYISIVLECDRSLTIYPTPAALEELNDLFKKLPVDASYELFEDLVGNGWEIDTDCYEQLTEDGVFYPDENTDEGSFWAYGWSYDDYVYRCLYEDILLRGEASMTYFRHDINDEQKSVLRREYTPTISSQNESSLAQQLADAVGYEVIIE